MVRLPNEETMWKEIVCILVLCLSYCVSENNQQDADSSNTNLMNLLSGNGIYNPLDPMGFIFEGKSEQYKGNGIDTPRYNPDKYAYTFAGVAAYGPGANPFIPNPINSESINNSPNYAQHTLSTTPKSDNKDSSVDSENNNVTKQDMNTFSQLPIATGGRLNTPMVSQTFPEYIMSALNRNASSMFPEASFSGQPGMLGVGKQLPLQPIKPDHIPTPKQQYLPDALENITEVHVLLPVYDYKGFESVVGSKQQVIQTTDSRNTSTPVSLYSGYPGMLGQIHNDMNNQIQGKAEQAGKDSNRKSGYSNSDHGPSGKMSSGSNYVGTIPGVNTNNWKGEWPGKSDTGGDWSGNWADKWPKNEQTNGDNGGESSQFGESGKQHTSSSGTNWNGNWAGSNSNKGNSQEQQNSPNEFGNLGKTMAALEKLLGMLNTVTTSADTSGSGKASSPTFSEMVAGWKEQMKP